MVETVGFNMNTEKEKAQELKNKIKYLHEHPEENTYTGWNCLADCKCRLSEQYYVELMLLY